MGQMFWQIVLGALLLTTDYALASVCALTVQVYSPNGSTAQSGVPVSLARNGKVYQSLSTNSGGQATVCDPGFEKFDIVVGHLDTCGAIVIKDIEVIPPDTLTIPVFRVRCEFHTMATGCFFAIRLVDPEDRPIVGATANRWMSDEYGRLLTAAKVGTRDMLTVRKDGFSPIEVLLDCAVLQNGKKLVRMKRLVQRDQRE